MMLIKLRRFVYEQDFDAHWKPNDPLNKPAHKIGRHLGKPGGQSGGEGELVNAHRGKGFFFFGGGGWGCSQSSPFIFAMCSGLHAIYLYC